MDAKPNKSWTLTGLCCEFDLPFATAMSYRKGYVHIEPDVKVPGASKKQFSPRQAVKFLVARRLFKAGIVGKVVQRFFAEVIDDYDSNSNGSIFNELGFKDFPPTEFVTEELLTKFYRLSMPEEQAVIQAKMMRARMKLKDLYEEFLRVSWLVAYDPADPDKTAAFININVQPFDIYQNLIQTLSNAKWVWTVICLGSVKDELWGRVESNYKCIDYKPKSAGQQVKEALDAFFRKERVQQ